MSLQPQGAAHYTYADYLTWDGGERYELIDGAPYMMAAPAVIHQVVRMEICRQISNYLINKPCQVFAAPFDVRLNADGADDTVVQPDISVVCGRSKIENGKCCKGAPDFVIEIVSTSSKKLDKLVKFNKYWQAGVREYWIIEPDEPMVWAYVLKGGEYVCKAFDGKSPIPVSVLEGCAIDMQRVFAQANPGQG